MTAVRFGKHARREASPDDRRRAAEPTIPADPVSPDSGAPPPEAQQAELAGWQAAKIAAIAARVRADDPARYHASSAKNGRALVRWLREDSPWLTDSGLAIVLLTWLEFTERLGESPDGPEVTLQAYMEAAELAVFELTAAIAPQSGEV